METQNLLKNYSDEEKGAYLTAIASIASADRSASEDEINFLKLLSQEAELNEEHENQILQAAQRTDHSSLESSLDILKNSELKYSLMTDLLSFAKADQNYSAEEESKIEGVANYLGVTHDQYEALNLFAEKTANTAVDPQEVSNPSFLSSLGLEEKFKNSGLNLGSIGGGLLGFLAPMLLSKLMGSRSGGSSGGLGGLGSILGSLAGGGLGGSLSKGGGLGGMLGGGSGGGGLGSLISVLSGGRGLGSAGGLLSKIL